MQHLRYRNDIDAWKGFAIVAIILYHMGILKSGYLGVEIFLVVNGFLVIPPMVRQIQEGRFSYVQFLKNKLMRFMPLVVAASALCLAIGYTGMIPDDYENLAETAFASDFFSQNLLASITTKDYWKSSNAFCPLMHMWFIGILVEFYILFPLLLLALKKISRGLSLKKTSVFLVVLSILSIGIFINPNAPAGDRFYLLPYRLFEFTLGGLVGLHFESLNLKFQNLRFRTGTIVATSAALVALTCISLFYIHQAPLGLQPSIIGGLSAEPLSSDLARTWLTLLAVLLSCFVISLDTDKFTRNPIAKALGSIGKMSFSLFVWHQVFIAFYRYFVSPELSAAFVCFSIGAVAITAIPSYLLVEKIKANRKNIILTLAANIIVTGLAFWIYLAAGVVRDVPELNVYKGDSHRNMFSEYCDRIYAYDIDFPLNGKPNVLVVFGSFARDFANVLLESPYGNQVNLSYAFDWEPELVDRIKKSDYIFAFGEKGDIPLYVFKAMTPETQLWGIGTKNFGMSNGNIYRHRHEPSYFEQSIALDQELSRVNDLLKKSWGKNYVDFVALSLDHSGRIPLFTPDHKYISQDGNHFTESGARHFAKLVEWKKIFK